MTPSFHELSELRWNTAHLAGPVLGCATSFTYPPNSGMAEEEDHDLSEIHVEPPSNEYSKASEVGFMCEDPSV